MPGARRSSSARFRATARDTVLLYGHMDKQPEFTGWAEGLSPWEPVIRDGKLYGRGGADDGYAVFSSLTAIRLLQAQKIPHARCVVLIEACEESGSYDLPHYVEMLADRIGTPSLVVCLDAECGNYDQLWCTTSLRGNLVGDLVVEGLTEGVHSGAGTGIAPSVFRIARTLLARVESDVTGDLLVDELSVPIPPARIEQARAAAGGARPPDRRQAAVRARRAGAVGFPGRARAQQHLAADARGHRRRGLPAMENAGNVLLPRVEFKLSFRLPPSGGCRCRGRGRQDSASKPTRPTACASASRSAHRSRAGTRRRWRRGSRHPCARPRAPRSARTRCTSAPGGSIPFIGMLGERFPGTQFLVTGVLGPHSNAHGPNEFLHLDCAEKLTVCVAQVIADHHARPRD